MKNLVFGLAASVLLATSVLAMGSSPPVVGLPQGLVMKASPQVIEEVKRIATRLYEEGEDAYKQYQGNWTITTLDIENRDNIIVETPFNRAVNYCYMAMLEASQGTYDRSQPRTVTNNEIAAFFDQPAILGIQAVVYIGSPGESSNYTAVLYKNKGPIKLKAGSQWQSSNSEFYPDMPKYRSTNSYEFDISGCTSTDVLELDIVKHPEGQILDVNFDPPKDVFKIDLSGIW
ncbi:MAG: hypothetical protein ABIJ26_00945 [Candidatus Margulisiibacteriota bacterium]|nr:hypothetical protein [Candidatus Margulisiibacteriota bacterium]